MCELDETCKYIFSLTDSPMWKWAKRKMNGQSEYTHHISLVSGVRCQLESASSRTKNEKRDVSIWTDRYEVAFSLSPRDPPPPPPRWVSRVSFLLSRANNFNSLKISIKNRYLQTILKKLFDIIIYSSFFRKINVRRSKWFFSLGKLLFAGNNFRKESWKFYRAYSWPVCCFVANLEQYAILVSSYITIPTYL